MHYSVLLNESIESLQIKEDGIYVDCTLGYAGHSSEILKRIKKGKLVAIDQDLDAIKASDEKLKKIGSNYTIIKSNFVNMKEKLLELGIDEVDGILFDLGVSSPQLDEDERGFSFHKDAKLDMRMNREQKLTAWDVVNNYPEKEIANILFRYGEEKYGNSIARNIVKEREKKSIDSTLELVEIIKKSVPMKYARDKHPARKTFQAIRIEVNNELEILDKSIRDSLSMLKVGGILSVITFHSLEDRIIKNIFKEVTSIDPKLKGLPNVPNEYLPDYELVNNKAIEPGNKELEENNRSRSAKLRVIKKIK